MNLRTCRYCCKEKPIDDFEIANTVNGVEYRRWRCSSCYNELKRRRRHRIRDWFVRYKQSLSCADCGIVDFRVLEFHHTSSDKDADISNIISRGQWSQERIEREIAKCIPLCANCHRIRHWIDNMALESDG